MVRSAVGVSAGGIDPRVTSASAPKISFSPSCARAISWSSVVADRYDHGAGLRHRPPIARERGDQQEQNEDRDHQREQNQDGSPRLAIAKPCGPLPVAQKSDTVRSGSDERRTQANADGLSDDRM